MLRRYFTIKLRQAGFHSVDNIYWSLNSCQGDGVSFTCSLSQPDLIGIFERIHPLDTHKAYDRVTNLMKRRCTFRFLEETGYCAKLSLRSDSYTGSFNMRITSEFWPPDEDDDLAECDWEESREMISDEVVTFAMATADALERDGYAIEVSTNTENTVVWKFVTTSYAVVVTEIPEIREDALDYWDEECFVATCQSMIAGTERLTCLKAEIIDANTLYDDKPTVLAETFLGGVIHRSGDRRYHGLLREIVSEVIAEFRHKSEDVAKAA